MGRRDGCTSAGLTLDEQGGNCIPTPIFLNIPDPNIPPLFAAKGPKMNIKQKLVIVVGAILLMLSGLFPVRSVSIMGLEQMICREFLYSDGRACLARYMRAQSTTTLNTVPKVVIDYGRMKVEWSGIILLTIAAIVVLRERPLQ